MLVKIHITLKKDVLDPQGKVIANSLSNLGFEGIQSVRQGKYIEIMLDGNDKNTCLLYTSPSPRDATLSRMPSSA